MNCLCKKHRIPPARRNIAAITLLAFAMLPAFPNARASAEIRKEAIDNFVSLIGVTPSRQDYFLGKSISGYKYDFKKEAIEIGGKNGTGYYHSDTASSLEKNSPTLKYKATVRANETGYSAGMRFGDYKKHAVRFGISEKEVTLDPYTKTIFQGDCQPCNLRVSQADISAKSKFIEYSYDILKSWKLGTEYESETNSLDTLAQKSLKTKIFTIAMSRKTNKSAFTASISEYKSSSMPNNRHMHLSFERAIKGKFSAFVQAGLFAKGLPLASGPFSDLGDRFAFNYLSGENRDFNTLYSEKFGYYSIGLKATLNVK